MEIECVPSHGQVTYRPMNCDWIVYQIEGFICCVTQNSSVRKVKLVDYKKIKTFSEAMMEKISSETTKSI